GCRIELEPTASDVLFRDSNDPSRESAVTGALLSVVRSVRELATLADLAEQYAEPDRPLFALVDGNLALWNIDKPGLPPYLAEDLKHGPRGIVEALNRLRVLADARRVVFAGYVSGTAAANVVHSLRVLACPSQPRVECKACPGKATGTRPCD